MKTAKANLVHPTGGTFLSHAVTQLQSCCEQIVCSVAPRNHLPEGFSLSWIPPGVAAIHDSVPERGPAEGLHQSLRHAETLGLDGCLTLAVDMPMVQSEHLAEVLGAAESHPATIICAVDPKDQMLQPLFGFYPVSSVRLVGELAASSRRSLHRMVCHHDHHRVSIPTSALLNVNTSKEWNA